MKKITFLHFFVVLLIVTGFCILARQTVHAQTAACQNAALTLTVRNSSGGLVENINWALYKQEEDADGNPLIGKLVVQGTTGAKGLASVKFNPGPEGMNIFALKIWGINANAGSFTYWDKTIGCGDDVHYLFVLSRLRVVIRDVVGTSLKNYKWMLYTQKLDVDDKPITDAVVSENLTTEKAGISYVNLAPGTYIVRIPAAAGLYYQVDNVSVSPERETLFYQTLSSIRFIAKNINDEKATNVPVEIWSQKVDISNQPIADVKLTSLTIGNTGFADIFLPPNLYAVKSGTTWIYNVKISSNMITEVRMKQKGDPKEVDFVSVSEPRKTPTRPDNTLIKGPGASRMYVLKNGLRSYIPNMLIFNAYGYKSKDVITVSASELASYTEGPAMELPEFMRLKDGDLVKSAKSAAVYLIEGKMKKLFVSGAAFESNGYSWKNIKVVSDLVINNYTNGPTIQAVTIKNGSLVKTADDPTVYLIENNMKRPFINGDIFVIRGYFWKDIQVISKDMINKYTTGEPLSMPGEYR